MSKKLIILSFVVGFLGCSDDPRKASKENFEKIIRQDLADHPDHSYCFETNRMPITDEKLIAPFVELGLVKKTINNSPDDCKYSKDVFACYEKFDLNGGIFSNKKFDGYTYTPKALEIPYSNTSFDYKSGICYATVKLDKIINWEEGDFDGHYATVHYTVKVDKIASWMSESGLNTFNKTPNFKRQINLTLLNDGWHSKPHSDF